MIKGLIRIFSIFIVFIGLVFFYGKNVRAEEGYDIECVSDGISRFTDGVINGVGGKPKNIKFLSPVFNMTEPDFVPLLQATISKTSSWNSLDGAAGNAYNVSSEGTITSFVNIMRGETGSMPIMLTETGWYPHATQATNNPSNRSALKSEIASLKADSGIIGGLIFNVFGVNPDASFAGQVMNNSQITEVCSGTCGKIGANSASFLQDDGFHSRAQGLGMSYVLSIIPNDVNQVAAAANNAYDHGVSLVLRIGLGDDSGGFGGSVSPQEPVDPQITADFIKQLDSKLKGTVYIILGPNEPNAEGWADPEYPGSCSRTGPVPRDQYFKISGQVVTSRVTTFPGGENKKDFPVGGVKVTAYEGSKSNLETCKDDGSLTNMSKKQDGTPNIVSTDANGFFEIFLKKNSGCKKANYLVFVAGSNPLHPSKTIVDMWRVTTTQDFEKDMGSLMISADIEVKLTRSGEDGCDTSNSPRCFIAYTDTTDPPGKGIDPKDTKFEYVDRLDFLTCATTDVSENIKRTLFNVSRGISATFEVEFKDKLWQGADASDVPISTGASTLTYGRNGEDIPKNTASGDLSGRLATTGYFVDVKNMVANATCLFVGCPEGPIKLAKYKDSAAPDIPDCKVYKQANQSIPTDSAWRSSSFYGPAIQLADPAFSTGVRMSENGLRYLASFKDLKDVVVCKNNGQDIKFSQIQSPWYNDPEVSGRTGGGYLLGVEYFPWNRLFGGKRYESVAEGVTQTPSDSYESPEARTVAFDPTLQNTNRVLSQGSGQNSIPLFPKSKDIGVFTAGTNGQNASGEAAFDATQYKKTDIDGTEVIIEPPQKYTSTPKFGSEAEPGTSLIKEYSFKKGKGVGYVRLGKPEPLCVKSSVEGVEGKNPFNFVPFADALKAAGLTADTHFYSAGYSFVTKANSTDNVGLFFGKEVTNLFPKIFTDLFAVYDAPWREGSDHQTIQDVVGSKTVCGVGKYLDLDNETFQKIVRWFFGYNCEGDIKKDLKTNSTIVQTPTKNVPTAVSNFYASFMPPFEGTLQAAMGAIADVTVTKTNSPLKGFGVDAVANSEEPSYITGRTFDLVRDPIPGTAFKIASPAPARKKVPRIPSDYGNCYLGRTDPFGGAMSTDIPDYMEQILNRAGAAYNVPAAMLVSVLYSEGAFNRGYDWSETNIMNASIEGNSFTSDCDPDDTFGAQPPFSIIWGYHSGAKASKIDFPGRVLNRCNFLDQAYAAAEILSSINGSGIAYGKNFVPPVGYPAPKDCATGDCSKCFGTDYALFAGSCYSEVNWSISNTVTASRGYGGFCFDNIGTGAGGTVFECPAGKKEQAVCRETYQGCGNGASCSSYVNNIVRVYDFYKH